MVNPGVIMKRIEQIEKHLERMRSFASLSYEAAEILFKKGILSPEDVNPVRKGRALTPPSLPAGRQE